MIYNRPILIQKIDENEDWQDFLKLHAYVNKNNSDQTFKASTYEDTISTIFNVRYCHKINEINYKTADYRIIYFGKIFQIINFDDFEERHQSVKLVGEYRGIKNG